MAKLSIAFAALILFHLSLSVLASEQTAALRLQGTVPSKMGITLDGGSAQLPPPAPENSGGYVELTSLSVVSNAGESYAVFVSSENGSMLQGSGSGSGMPYELAQGTEGGPSRGLSLEKGKQVRAWLSSPDRRGISKSTGSLQVRLRDSGSRGRRIASDRGLLHDTVTLTVVSY